MVLFDGTTRRLPGWVDTAKQGLTILEAMALVLAATAGQVPLEYPASRVGQVDQAAQVYHPECFRGFRGRHAGPERREFRAVPGRRARLEFRGCHAPVASRRAAMAIRELRASQAVPADRANLVGHAVQANPTDRVVQAMLEVHGSLEVGYPGSKAFKRLITFYLSWPTGGPPPHLSHRLFLGRPSSALGGSAGPERVSLEPSVSEGPCPTRA